MTSFPSVPPQGHETLSPPPSPEFFLFPRPDPFRTLNARGQSATFQRIPSWGGEGGARRQAEREKFSTGGFGLLRPLFRDQGHGAVRANRGPKRSLQSRQAAATQSPQVWKKRLSPQAY